MKIIREYKDREIVFDNLNSDSLKRQISVDNETLFIDYQSIIDSQFSGGNVGQDFESLKQFLNLGLYAKAPCGGFPNFFLINGNKRGDYILFSGINEVSHSHYIVTIHKLLKK